ncbi:MAG: hypothetical protein JWN15_1536, partial [Firmicutes bacterium]|nr:hypothetical protein [Bacillota bacterium]
MTGSGLRTYARNHYFFGKLMTVRDFRAEQEYHRDKQSFHNRFLHDYGVVAGLKVQGDAGGSPCRLVLAPGFAVDACGREIVVPQAVDLDLTALLAEAKIPQDATEVYVRLAYAECETEPVPVYARQCNLDDECAANRMSEGFRVRVTTDSPAETGGGVSDICGLVQQAVGPAAGQPGGGNVADASAPDLYKLLCARSLDAEPWAGQACGPQQQADLHLATVTMKDGAPVLDTIDNVTGRRILLSTGDLTALLLCLTRSVADCCGGKGEGPTYAIVLTTAAPVPQQDGTYQLDLTAALVDAHGQPGPANLPVDWSAGQGAVLAQPQTLTDASGKASVQVSGMAPGGTYDFTAAAIGATANAQVILPAAAVASISIAQKEWAADQDGSFQLPFEATVRDQFEQTVVGAALAWTVDPAAKIDAEANSGAGGIGHATIAQMAAGTDYTVTVAAGSATAATAVTAPTPAPAVISVQEVQRTPLADGTVDVALSATIIDQFKRPMPK